MHTGLNWLPHAFVCGLILTRCSMAFCQSLGAAFVMVNIKVCFNKLNDFWCLPLIGTNSEMSNASESEDLSERDPRPRGVGGEERGSRRGGRGRGSSTGRGRGGPASRSSNTISSGTQLIMLVCNFGNNYATPSK